MICKYTWYAAAAVLTQINYKKKCVDTITRKDSTGCSLNIVLFYKNSRKFATSPSPALGCYWLYKKSPANRSDCTLALR